jgi:uncharacterized protein YceH (UPF0502 family)
MTIALNTVEARVLGCLLEKSITTPDYYPLTVNSVVAACNQKSNRDPIMSVDEETARKTLDALRYEHHIVWEVSQAGSRTLKYKHDVAGVVGLTDPELTIICVLLLRGPQTPGELRSRTARMHPFGDVSEVLLTLSDLQSEERGPLVVKLRREPGCREPRFMHLLCGEVDGAAGDADVEEPGSAFPIGQETANDRHQAARQFQGSDGSMVRQLADQLAALQAELENLRREFDEFKANQDQRQPHSI